VESASAYFFIELAALTYLLGFGWGYWKLKELRSRELVIAAAALAFLWFLVDQIAVWQGIWAFPQGNTVPVRLFSLPIEEYLVFFLHTFGCAVLVNRYARSDT
jgi:lycopene cyclase domain-containing protein